MGNVKEWGNHIKNESKDPLFIFIFYTFAHLKRPL